MRGARQAAGLLVAAAMVTAGSAVADTVVDRAVVRFIAPETGGAEHPRFVLERTLAFESRLEAMSQSAQGLGEVTAERDARNALEHDLAQQLLATLAQKLIDDSPAAQRPAQSEIDGVTKRMSLAWVERLGGRGRVDAAAALEQLDPSEVDGLLARGGLAAWYLDRVVTPLLHPSEEQLRDVYRTSPHPYRGQPFEKVREKLEGWFVVDRVRVAESAFLQAARSHVRVIVTR